MKFSKKTAHRLIIALSMFAPVVYLFGAMFFGLAGAHGEKIYEDEIVIDQTPTYDELMTPENFRYDAFEWSNVNGTRYGFSLGYLYDYQPNDNDWLFSITPYGVRPSGMGLKYFENYGLGWPGAFDPDNSAFWDAGVDYELNGYTDDSWAFDGDSYFCLYVHYHSRQYDDDWQALVLFRDGTYLNWYYNNPDSEWVGGLTGNTFTDYDELYFYFDDGRQCPYEFIDGMKEYFVPTVKAVEVSSSSYTASIFGQFFPHDNFLERVGVNALSANPIGFAPFGTFLSYLDQNMLHGSQSQMALMIYGEVYWALHIVLADLVYHVAVFFPNLIERVFDWFGQKGLNDD